MWDGKAMVKSFLGKYNILFFVCAASVIFAGNDEEFFLRGNKYYATQEYDSALQAYNMIEKKGHAVLYNMGNCSFKKEDYPQALVYWSRAQAGANKHEYNLIQYNKELALRKLGKQKEQSWQSRMIVFAQAQSLYLSLLFLQILFLVFWWVFILVMRKKQTGSAKVAQSIVCCCLAVFATLLSMHYVHENAYSAIIVKKEAKLFAGPDKNFAVLSPVAYADGVAVKETREGWHKIQYADKIGWVEADVIQII
jgi:tetratricopeptide (TPR) repeat protein